MMATWQSKEDQKKHIRSQLIHEVNNPDVFYPISKKNRDKLNNGSYEPSHKLMSTFQTKDKMTNELQDFVLNPDVPDNMRSRDVWMSAHPDDVLTSDDIIHHINGNHDDNRIGNLVKITSKQHRIEHMKMIGRQRKR